MKTIFPKINLLFFVFSFTMSFAQNHVKLPENTVFYMEINGNTLNKKVNWEKFNPILQEISQKNNKKYNWSDYSKNGIKYDDTQYHYATYNDSIKSYNAHFKIDNKDKFLSFINSSKKEGLEISKKNKYSCVDLGDNVFVAWDDHRAMLSFISYSKPYKDVWINDDKEYDSVATVIDSAAVAIEKSAPEITDTAIVKEEEEKPEVFDYKAEIEYLKDDIKYLNETIKDDQKEILRIQKDIKYLEKHHQYPDEPVLEKTPTEEPPLDDTVSPPPPPAISKEQAEEIEPMKPMDDDETSDESDLQYQKELDSIRIEEFKITKKIAEIAFNQYFDSDFQIETTKEMLKYRDAKSDVFVFTNFANMFSGGFPNKMYSGIYNFEKYFGKMYDSHSSYNLYFENDKVRLVNNYQHKNPEIQNNISKIYNGKKNRKLASLINDNNIGYYAININGAQYFDFIYSFFNDDSEEKYQKEIDLMIETMKIVLDEKAIAKIAPGNGIFVLHQLKSQKVDYTDYEYDDNYNSKEIKKTKEITVPDFSFAFVTDNENYWHKVFEMLTNNKEVSRYFNKTGNIYTLKQERSNVVNKLFFTIKDGIVYCSTSVENIFNNKPQSSQTRKFAKQSYKHSISGNFDVQQLLVGLEKEFPAGKDKKDSEIYNFLKKNAGTINYKTDKKGDSIETEINYMIHHSTENSLMYFFYIIDELYKLDSPIKKIETIF